MRPVWLVKVRHLYKVRLLFDPDEFGMATMTKTFAADSKAEATELARLELGLSPREAAHKLTVEEIA